jgi:Mg-chelatase subunit ChlD
MKRKLSLFLIIILVVNSFVTFADTYNYQVSSTLTRTFSRNDVVLDNVIPANNDVTVTYTFDFDDIPSSSIPVATPPKEVVLIMDKSGSMKWDLDGNKNHSNATRMSIAKSAAVDFVENLAQNKNIKLSVIRYDSKAYVYSYGGNELIDISNNHSNKNVIKSHINGISANGGTNVGDAIRRGYHVLNNGNPNADKFLVFLTDGEPTVYTRKSSDNDNFYLGSGSAPSTRTHSSLAKDYAIEMTKDLEVFNKNYFIAFSNNGANKLKEISETIRSYYKKALNSDEIEEVYKDISYEISADLSVDELILTDTLPGGLEVVDKPANMTVNGPNISMPVGQVSYKLNANGTAYVADPITVTMTVRTSTPGTYDFTGGSLSYLDIDGNTRSKSIPSSQLRFERTPIENVIATRQNGDNGNPLNSVDLSWDVYPGAVSYNIYKNVAGTDVLLGTVNGNSNNTYNTPITSTDSGSTTYRVEGVLADGQLSGKGSVVADTNPSILNLKVNRINDSFYVSWDQVDGASKYLVRPTIKGVVGTTIDVGLPSVVGGRVTYIYPYTPDVTDTIDDMIQFNVDGEKTGADVNDADSEAIRIKQLVNSVIVTGLDDFKYASIKEIQINISSESVYPSGVSLFDPVLVVELSRPDNDVAPLEFSYSTLRVERAGSIIGSTVTNTGSDNVVIYTELPGYVDSKLPANESLSMFIDFGIAFDVDHEYNGKTLINNIKSVPSLSHVELYNINTNIVDVLDHFYTEDINSMITIKTYIMYNTSDKPITSSDVRDEIVGVSTGTIRLINENEIEDEF